MKVLCQHVVQGGVQGDRVAFPASPCPVARKRQEVGNEVELAPNVLGSQAAIGVQDEL
jgi:hypothetical protein